MSIEHLDEPAEAMTQAQASYLQTLAAAAGDTFDSGLSKAAAAKRIAELERKTQQGPPQADAGDGGSSIRANESRSATESADGPPQEEH
ncbi:MAG: DUF3072 domain-containing protein [Deltaproteobacteria bacterium]